MTIQVNSQLKKSRNPTEYGFKLENQQGEIAHILGDGYCLIKFKQFKINALKRVDSKKVLMSVELEWYVHDTDFYLIK